MHRTVDSGSPAAVSPDGPVEVLTGSQLIPVGDARGGSERRYLDGHAALFPDAIADWEQLPGSPDRLAGLG